MKAARLQTFIDSNLLDEPQYRDSDSADCATSMLSSRHSTTRSLDFLRGCWPPILLLSCHLLLGLTAVARKSATSDEGAHLLGGLSYWATGDFRLNPESGNWPQRWAALPVWLRWHPSLPTESAAWQKADQWKLAEQIFYESGNDADAMLFQGRLMVAVLSTALGAVVYFWSRQLFGYVGGLISLTLYVFSPSFLSNGFLITADLAVALFFCAAIWACWTLMHTISLFTLTASALTLSGLALSKFSGVLMAPMVLLLLCIRLFNRQPLICSLGSKCEISGPAKQLAALCGAFAFEGAIVVTLIWASYGFHYQTSASSEQASEASVVSTSRVSGKLGSLGSVVQFSAIHHLLPEPFLYGFAYTTASAQTRRAFLNGNFSTHGWIGFFPYCFLVKTPPDVFVILFISLAGALLWRTKRIDSHECLRFEGRSVGFYAISPLVVLLAVYWAASLCSHLNIGQRHLLPTYPPIFILAGAAAVWFYVPPNEREVQQDSQGISLQTASGQIGRIGKSIFAIRGLVLGCLAIALLEALSSWPNYLAYFNVFAGGPSHGYQHLVDSSLDWGQDLKELKRWLDANATIAHDNEHLYIAYFGPTPPRYYGIEGKLLTGVFDAWQPHVPQPLTAGTYCISATMLEGIYVSFPGKWNEQYEYLYQQLSRALLDFNRGGGDAVATQRIVEDLGAENIDRVFQAYEQLRAARLYSFLRRREPDDNVGHSILIFRLSDADLHTALDESPVELLPACEPDAKEILPIRVVP